jgi:8-oxo-dGTP pyrophosphatase MutT (NUDIX family)
VKPLKTEVTYKTPWFEVVGKTMRADEAPYYSLRLPDYAAVVAFTEDGRILVVRQYRPAVERFSLELPSGIIDPGEEPAETARRELLEETGYAAARAEVIGPLLVDTGRLSNRIFGCVATGALPVDGCAPEEGIEVFAWTVDELWRATRSGEFALSLHIAVLMQAVLAGKLRIG